MSLPSRHSNDTSQPISVGAVSDVPKSPSVWTNQSDSDMCPSIYTCHSPGYHYTYPTTDATTESVAQDDSNGVDGSQATSADIPSMPSSSSVGPSGSSHDPAPSTSEPRTSSTSESTLSEMGPHVREDHTMSGNQEFYSYKEVMKMPRNQWFVSRLLVQHKSSSHQILAVSPS